MSKLINKKRMLEDGTIIEAHYEDASILRYGSLVGSTHHYLMDGNTVSLRIPWTRINISDPSSFRVLDDERLYYSDPLRDVISIKQIEAILISAILCSVDGNTLLDATDSLPFSMEGWNQPTYQERMKASYELLQAYFYQEKSL